MIDAPASIINDISQCLTKSRPIKVTYRVLLFFPLFLAVKKIASDIDTILIGTIVTGVTNILVQSRYRSVQCSLRKVWDKLGKRDFEVNSKFEVYCARSLPSSSLNL